MTTSYKYGKTSKKRLSECHEDIQKLMNEALKTSPCDISILCGHRGEEEQNEAFRNGNSKLQFPNSKHNSFPSVAVDIAPYPIDWKDIDRFKLLAVHIKYVAKELGIDIKWGGDWKSFKDYPHWELNG